MLIDFKSIPVSIVPHMKGGEKEFAVATQDDGLNKIMKGTLIPGASIGLHTHDTSSEIIYVLSGTGKMICDGQTEVLSAGMCHYCPKGHSHTFINESGEDLTFFAVVPNQ